MSRQQLARTQQAHSVEVRQVYERVLAGSPVRSRHVEMGAGGRVHLLEKGAGPPVVLLHGTGNSAGFLLPLLNELHGVRAIAPDLPGVGLSDPIDLPARSLPRDRGRMAGPPARHPRAGRHHAGWPFGGWGVGVVVRAGSPGPGQTARADRPPALPKTRCPLPIRLVATPGVGDTAVAAGATQPEVGAAVGERHGRAGDPRPSPGPDRPVGGHGPGPGHRPRRQGGDPRAGLAVRLAVAVPGSGVVHACDPTSCARWPCPRWWSGANATRSAAFRSPRRSPT